MGKLKRKITGIYKNQRNVKSNICPEEEQAITKPSQDDSVIVKPSDTCKGLVIVKKETYVDKAKEILESYEQVPTGGPKFYTSTAHIFLLTHRLPC